MATLTFPTKRVLEYINYKKNVRLLLLVEDEELWIKIINMEGTPQDEEFIASIINNLEETDPFWATEWFVATEPV